MQIRLTSLVPVSAFERGAPLLKLLMGLVICSFLIHLGRHQFLSSQVCATNLLPRHLSLFFASFPLWWVFSRILLAAALLRSVLWTLTSLKTLLRASCWVKDLFQDAFLVAAELRGIPLEHYRGFGRLVGIEMVLVVVLDDHLEWQLFRKQPLLKSSFPDDIDILRDVLLDLLRLSDPKVVLSTEVVGQD